MSKTRWTATIFNLIALPTIVLADIPARPEPPKVLEWPYLLIGVLCACVGALLFVWLGRKLIKR